MKRLFEIRHLIYLLVALGVAAPGCAGRRLDPAGVYAADPLLYDVDATYRTTWTLLDVVFQWEDRLPEGFAPKLRATMNRVRAAARKADGDFHRLRSAYRAAPTEAGRTAYEEALARLLAAGREANELFAKGTP